MPGHEAQSDAGLVPASGTSRARWAAQHGKGVSLVSATSRRGPCYDSSMRRSTIVMSRVLRDGEPDDGSFDRAFWRSIGAEGIFAASWEMVSEQRAFRGESGDEPRLQRSVVRVIRRAG